MSGYWIAFGWFLASIGIFGLLIGKRRKRITAHTYGIIMPGIATVTVVLAVGQVWQVYRSDATQTYIHNELQTLNSDRERIKGRLRALQDRIKSNNAARDEISQPGNLTPTTDPDTLKVRAERVAAFQKESSAIQEEGKSVSQDSRALKERADAVQSDLNELRIARSSRDFWVFICALVMATPILAGATFISRTQAKRLARLRALGIDQMMPSERVKQLADGGKKIEAIKAHREETGAWLDEAKEIVEKYIDGKRG